MKATITARPACYYAASRRSTANRFPNAASRRYFWERTLDAALAAAITVAVVTILLFLFALG